MADELKAEGFEAGKVWAGTLEELALQMTRQTFDTWLRGSWVIESSSGTEGAPAKLRIGVRHAYAVDWLMNRLLGLVNRTAERRAGRPVVVSFEVASPPTAIEAEPDPEVDTIEETGPMIEAVREEKVTVSAPGGPVLQWVDFYIKLKVAFRKRGLKMLKGAPLSVFLCLALHVDRNGIAAPGGIEAIMSETDYSRGAVCSALEKLEKLGLIETIPVYRAANKYRVLGYAWFGQRPAPALWESKK